MPYKTTKKDFEVFKAECRKWVKYFGLLDWDVSYSNYREDGCRGSCSADFGGRLCTINLAKKWDYKPKKSELKRIAFHEVCELITAPLCIWAENRFSTQTAIDSANHYIIRILENTVFERGIK